MYEPVSSMAHTYFRGSVITAGLLSVIRNLFSDPNNIESENLKNYVWNPDPKFSKILIEPTHLWKPEDVQHRPSVLVKRGDWQIGKVGIGDRQLNQLQETGFEEDKHAVTFTGGHQLLCVGTTGAEVELIAEEVWMTLLGFSTQIREQFCLGMFQVQGIGQIGTFEESHDHFAVPVTVTYATLVQWSVTRQTPEWMNVTIDTQVR